MARTPDWLRERLQGLDEGPERDALVLATLADPDPAIREVAVAWAARSFEPGRLLRFVGDQADATLRNAALSALERQGPMAIPAVALDAASSEPDQAMFACQVLGRVGGPGCLHPLLGALAHPDPNVVQAAAEALGRVGSPLAVPALLELLAREPWLQLPALDALGAIGDPTAVPAILDLVPDSFVARPALEALARIGAPTAVLRLAELLADQHPIELRPAMVQALAAALEATEPFPHLSALADAVAADESPQGLLAFLRASLVVRRGPAPPGEDRAEGRDGGAVARAGAIVAIAAGATALLPSLLRLASEPECAEWLLPRLRRAAAFTAALEDLTMNRDPRLRAASIAVAGPNGLGSARLLAALDDDVVEVALRAAEELVQRADVRVLPRLFDWLRHDSGPGREAAIAGLSRFPTAVVEPLLRPLLTEDGTKAERQAALAILARLPCAGLEDAVYASAASPDPEIRRAAYGAVAQLHGSKAEVVLLRALADREAALQLMALDLLVRRGGERLVATLRALLSTEDSLRYHVIRALGRLRATEAVRALQALFPRAPLHEQVEVVAALGAIGGRGVHDFLAGCLSHAETEIRRAAAKGIASNAGPEDADLLLELAHDRDWVLRGEAARGLARIDGEASHAALLDLARDVEPTVARVARAVLIPAPVP
jgi:HEAT repeat protein